jgi:hypothetical protein
MRMPAAFHIFRWKPRILLLAAVAFLSSCAAPRFETHQRTDQLIRGLIHFEWHSSERNLTGNLAIAMHSSGWCQLELLDPLNASRMIGAIDQETLLAADINQGCFFSLPHLQKWSRKKLGLPLNGEILWEVLGKNPWISSTSSGGENSRTFKNCLLQYAVLGPESRESLTIEVRKKHASLKLVWLTRRISENEEFRRFRIEDKFSPCRNEELEQVLAGYL